MTRFFLRDPRQKSVISGKPDGGWLKSPPSPAQWVHRRELARAFNAGEIEAMRQQWPYLAECEIVAEDDAGEGR